MIKKIAKQRESGFSLVEAIVAVGVLGITVTINSNFLGSHLKMQKSAELITKRDELIERLKAEIVNPENIRASALTGGTPGNTILAACLDPFKTCPVTATNSGVQKNFILVNPAFETIAGTFGSPRYYDRDLVGNSAGPIGINLPFAVSAYFWATCPLNNVTGVPLTTCSGASVLNFRFKIESFISMPELEYPKAADFLTGGVPNHRFSLAVSTKDIALSLGQSCNPGSVADGFTSEGKIKCKCLILELSKDANGLPVCAGFKCVPPERMLGIVDGMPLCQNTSAVICDKVPRSGLKGGTGIDCGPGYWLSSINPGTCDPSVGESKKTGSIAGIQCSGDTYTCCRRNI